MAPEYTGTGCSYLFYDNEWYQSFSLAWRRDGTVWWVDATTHDSRRLPDQLLRGANARLTEDGTIVGARLADLPAP